MAHGGQSQRVILMLQGPMSPFFAHLATALRKGGARVVKVHVCPADIVMWRGAPARWYRGRREDWPEEVDRIISAEGITDLVVFGDCRAHHAAAIVVAQARGIAVHAIELGYLRPDWLTVEPDGLASYSRLPSDPAEVRRRAEGLPPPDARRLARGSFLTETLLDIAFNLSNVILAPLFFPHYRRHAVRHPLAEYAGWIGKFLRAGAARRHRQAVVARLDADPAPVFLVPLQLSTDFQIRVHSPFARLHEAVDWIVASFAGNAPPQARLLFKIHPLDNGLDRWDRAVPQIAARHGVAERVDVVDGGNLETMIARSRAVVTVNSTVGLTALAAGRPVIVLGNAVFDLDGLTHQGPLSSFWTEPALPDAGLLDAFLRLLAGTVQVRGGVITGSQIAIGAPAVAARILEDAPRLAGPGRRRADALRFRRRDEWIRDREGQG